MTDFGSLKNVARVNSDVDVFDSLGQVSLKKNEQFSFDQKETVNEIVDGKSVVKSYYKVNGAWFSDYNPFYDKKHPFKHYISDMCIDNAEEAACCLSLSLKENFVLGKSDSCYLQFVEKFRSWIASSYVKELSPLFDLCTQISVVLDSTDETLFKNELALCLSKLKLFCNDAHTVCELAYDEDKSRTGKIVVKLDFPFRSVPAVSSSFSEVKNVLLSFTTPVVNTSCKATFTKCCLAYKNKLFWKHVPVYKDGYMKPKCVKLVCNECDVLVEKHRTMCGKLWGCQKCARVKEDGSKFCKDCNVPNSSHTSMDCLCEPVLNKMDSLTLKLLYKKHIEPNVDVDVMGKKYTKYVLKQALIKNKKAEFESECTPSSRGGIPQALRMAVWHKYIGKSKAESACYCCGINKIDVWGYTCGHIVSNKDGGEKTLENLRPICNTCNLSMGTRNLETFKSLFVSPK